MNSWNHDVIKDYANGIENERVNVEASCSFLENVFHDLNFWLL